MPIKFRCRHCRQFLGISRAQAGEITDCPMCGKSIRVPNLDGTIDPIPSPELDLKDSQLVEALGELAGIGKSHSPVEMTSPPRVSETYDATVIVAADKPAPPPKAVPIQPPDSLVADDSDTIIQGGNDSGTVVNPDDPLRSLAESSAPVLTGRSHRQWTRDRRPVWVMGTTAAVLMGLFAFIWLNDKSQSRPPVLEAAAGGALPSRDLDDGPPNDGEGLGVEHRVARMQQSAASDEEPAVTGRVTYVSESGDTVPDAGARVLLLPATKPGTVKLDVAGFLAGSEQLDADVAQAAIRAMGGDLATADEDGHYQLTVSAAGDYQLLAISRHRSRESTSSIDSRLQEALSAYFFRPASLLGGLSFHFEAYPYRGQGPSPRDISFADE